MTRCVLLWLLVLTSITPAQPASSAADHADHWFGRSLEDFAVDLWTVAARPRSRNRCLAPLPIQMILGQLGEGPGNGGSRLSFASRFRHRTAPMSELPRYLKRLTRPGVDGHGLRPFHELWFDSELHLIPLFEQRFHHRYGSKAPRFDRAKTPRDIRDAANKTVQKAMNGSVPDLLAVDPKLERGRIIAATALLFSGQWLQPFDPKLTRSRAFRLPAKGRDKMVAMMSAGAGNYQVYEDSEVKAVALRIATHTDFALQIVMAKRSLARLEMRNDVARWRRWHRQSKRRKLPGLHIPRFSVSYHGDLGASLVHLGVVDSTVDRAVDYGFFQTAISTPLASFAHLTSLSIDEAGLRPATTNAPATRPGPWDRVKGLIINRPFLFALRDWKTGGILLLGRVLEP
ncbi:MAG: hypothetical protein CMJ83_10765 [Planctomycetes bacterium]|nr:hypothetical protein [Planctomycetota bacterium]